MTDEQTYGDAPTDVESAKSYSFTIRSDGATHRAIIHFAASG